MEFNIRILGIKIKNVKNVKNGEIELESFKDIKKGIFNLFSSDIKGIYGPNGSSKTTTINSFKILKDIVLNNSIILSSDLYDLINVDENEASIELTFLDDSKIKRIYYYEIILNKDIKSKKGYIKNESLSFKEYDDINKKYLSKNKLFDIDYLNEDLNNIVKPNQTLSLIKKHNKRNFINLIKILTVAQTSNSSFIFKDSFNELLKSVDEFNSVTNLISRFKSFINYSMHIYTLENLGSVYLNNSIQVISKYNNEYQKFDISLFRENIIEFKFKNLLINYLKEIDLVINKIIPSMHIEMLDLGKSILNNANVGFKFEIISNRNNLKIPLRLESDGIKKIISLISSIIDIYSNKYSILIVDELDSGIFEYLLGELLKGIKEDAKGILIFTSHNLRPLEIIKNSIIFSSTIENERYITFPRISKTENLRNQYLKKLFLDESNEYADHIDTYELSRSFIKAGNLLNE